MNLYHIHYNVEYDHNGLPIEPPPNCRETLIPASDDLSTYFVCVPSLFRVHPPTREEELGRVLRTRGLGGQERVRARKGDLPRAVHTSHSTHSSVGRHGDDDNSDMSAEEDDSEDTLREDCRPSSIPSAPVPYPYPATAIPCSDPTWPVSIAAARDKARQRWRPVPNQPCPISQGTLPVGVDVSREEMAWVQEYLPREDLKFVKTKYGFEDMRSRLEEVNSRKGCLVLNNYSTGSKGFVFVFDVSSLLLLPCKRNNYELPWQNMLLLDEG
jgi:hypothetical protein